MTPKRVLISYAQESDGHRARVLALAHQLRAHGVDAWIDRFVAPPPEGWSHWMQGQLKLADRVIVVCTPTYFQRATRDAPAGIGLGVSWEWHLIRKEAYETRGEAGRIVPVFFDADGAASIPPEVWDRPRHDVHKLDGAGYLSLLDDLFERPEIAAGPVGAPSARPAPLPAAAVLSGTPSTTLHNLPPQPLDFIGRDDELARIHALVTSDKAVAISQPTSVSGLGGIGKTQLALRYALLHADAFDVALWVDAAGDDITLAFAALDRTLRLPVPPGSTVEDRAIAVREALEAGGPKLLVLDNVDHVKAIQPHLPRRGPTRVLMTTRLPKIQGTKTLSLDVLSPDEALCVLLGDREVIGDELAAARDLCAELEHLTLALAVAREVLASGLRTHRGLVDEIRQRGSVPWSEDVDPEFEDTLGKHPSLVRLFDASVKLLDPNTPKGRGAIAMLEVGGWFAAAPIELELLMDGTRRRTGEVEISDAHDLADALARVGLATCGSGEVAFHRLVGGYGRARSGPEGRRAMLHALVRLCSSTPTETMALRALVRHRQHLEAASASLAAQDDDIDVHWIPLRLMQAINHHAEHQATVRIGQVALPALSQALQQSYLLNAIGQALARQGKYAEALGCHERSLAIQEKTLGVENPETAITLHDIGQALAGQGRYAEALGYYLRSLEIKEKTLGTEHRDTAMTLTAIGRALAGQGEYAKSVYYYGRSLATNEKTLGAEHPETAITLHEIGRVLARQGKYAEALDYYGRSLGIKEKTLGTVHPDTAFTLNVIGQALAGQGKYVEALGYYLRSLEIKEKTLGTVHHYTAVTLHDIGQALARQAKYAEAFDYYERSLAIKEKTLGTVHPYTAITLHAIGQALADQGKYAEALGYHERALEIQEKTLGTEHPDTAIACATFAQLRQATGDILEARRLFAKALAVLDRTLGDDHPTTRAVRAAAAALEG